MIKVLGIGEVVLDRVCCLNDYPGEGIKVKPIEVELALGGPVAAALILLSRLGAQCHFIASVGQDEAGLIIKNKLRDENVKLHAHLLSQTKINTVLVNAQSGSRTIIKDKVKESPLQNISQALVEQADLIFFDRHEPIAFQEVLKIKKPKTRIVSDPSTEFSEQTIALMKHSDYPILPIEILDKLAEKSNRRSALRELFDIFQKPLIITAGAMGSLIFDGQKTEIIPAVKIKAIDTLGAGDIFRGAFGYGLSRNLPLRDCAVFANQVAGLQCAKLGNGSAIPTKKEIEQFIKKAKYRKISLSDLQLSQ